MRPNKERLEIAMANALINPKALSKKANLNYATVFRVMNGEEVKPVTVGKIAKALNVRVEDLMES